MKGEERICSVRYVQNDKKCSKIFYFFCILVAGIGIIMQCVCSFIMDIWVDEAFSLAMIKHSYREMITLTAMDVHPPLYYLILKLFVDIIHSFAASVPVAYLAKLASVVPMILLLALSMTKVRKNWGDFVSGLFSVCIVGMSGMLAHSVEIRMYSWGLFFVLAAFLEFYDILKADKRKSWALFVLFSLAAAYTHYFACVSVAFLYLCLLIYLIRYAKAQLKKWLLFSGITIVGYFPWLIVFLKQAKTVSEDYWIAEIGFSDILAFLNYMFENLYLFIFCILCFSFFLIALLKKAISKEDACAVMTAVIVPFGTIFVGIAASLLIRPVFISRYMVPSLACLWLGITLAVYLCRQTFIQLAYAIVILVFCSAQIVFFSNSELSLSAQCSDTAAFMEENEGSVFLTDNLHVQRAIVELYDTVCYAWGWDKSTDPLTSTVYSETMLCSTASTTDILPMLEAGTTIYLALCPDSALLQIILSENKFDCIPVGTYRFEYEATVYQLKERED